MPWRAQRVEALPAIQMGRGSDDPDPSKKRDGCTLLQRMSFRPDNTQFHVSAISLIVSITVAWLTLFRRGYLHEQLAYTATVTEVSVRVTGRYNVSRSMGSRPAARIKRSNSSRRMPWGVVAPASW